MHRYARPVQPRVTRPSGEGAVLSTISWARALKWTKRKFCISPSMVLEVANGGEATMQFSVSCCTWRAAKHPQS